MTRSLRPVATTLLDVALMVLGVGCAASEAAPVADEPSVCVVRESVELAPRRAGILGGTTAVQVTLPAGAWDDELVLASAIATAREGEDALAPTFTIAGIAVDPDLDLRDLIGRDDVLELDVEVEAGTAAATRARRFDLEICLATR
ncbi:MAG TPA: hypothetical protein VMZ28_22190 [Kofleriaceae bacterium]|nr:hypothetical protein [Kofleriaceae bacterium]